MQFSWIAAGITVFVTLIEAIVSIHEGTFSRKQYAQVNLSFLWHWGVVIDDFLILPIVNGLLIPHLKLGFEYIPYSVAAIIVTLFCYYKLWWPTKECQYGFILNRNGITKAGWVHFFFMCCELVIMGGYIFTPIPHDVAKTVTWLLLIFIPIGTIEPAIIQSGGNKRDIINSILIACGLMILTGAVAKVKLK